MDAVGMIRTLPEGRDSLVDTAPPESPRARAALHTAAAERLAQQHQWQQAYMHLQAAVELLRGGETHGVGTHDELDRLRREHAEAREQSRRDSLTATYNRRYLDERLAALLGDLDDAALRTIGICVALVDIDHFKLVNDTHGHLFGDRVLQRMVAELDASLPDDGFCARYGGEEFALVLPGRALSAAVEICETARERIAHHPWSELHPELRVTVSIGVAHAVGVPTEVEPLIGEADMLLYTAKEAGRNAVAYRAGHVRLAGPASGRRAIRQPVRTTG
ncbi:MAG: GGDEF domain-containing protein [Pseudonocardia sp.]|nr:GGDEF domain-containing protein [Pseudonocardia sp.]